MNESTLTVCGADRIYVTNSKGTSFTGSWNGTELLLPGCAWTASPAMAAKISAAAAAYRPAVTERLTGIELSRLSPAGREGFEWDRDADSDAGMYVRFTAASPAVVLPYAGGTDFTAVTAR
jgi:hypothetical protein